eukprot:6168930-Amphidinium_carterae.1
MSWGLVMRSLEMPMRREIVWTRLKDLKDEPHHILRAVHASDVDLLPEPFGECIKDFAPR